MATNINPIGPRVVAQKAKAQTKTASGIYLPEAAQEKPKTATVTAVGGMVKMIKKGDTIVYKEYAATELKINGEEFLVVNEEDILATIS